MASRSVVQSGIRSGSTESDAGLSRRAHLSNLSFVADVLEIAPITRKSELVLIMDEDVDDPIFSICGQLSNFSIMRMYWLLGRVLFLSLH